MVLLGFFGVGIVAGIIAHLILGRDGYSYFGEIMLGILGAVVFGMLGGIVTGMRTISAPILAISSVGSIIILAVVVVLTLRSRGAPVRT